MTDYESNGKISEAYRVMCESFSSETATEAEKAAFGRMAKTAQRIVFEVETLMVELENDALADGEESSEAVRVQHDVENDLEAAMTCLKRACLAMNRLANPSAPYFAESEGGDGSDQPILDR